MPIKIVSVWNPKGGQGKSMLSINIAAAMVQLGLKPLVICQDPQGTSMLFFRGGQLPFTVMEKIPNKKPAADIIIFDHQASDWAVPEANMLVMPVNPERSQYATYIDAYKRAEKENKHIFTVVTNGQNQRPEERKTTKYLLDKGAFVIPASGVFSRAAGEYRTIFDEALNKAYKIGQRRKELLHIAGAILADKNNGANNE
ncbi:hypothetical protein CI610_03050 [invertebrate metagenome]|uniref:AAA domain-containing protein n=1 Tax=invertebrate metagenome TaxID=1711999 RepID=A0A2H9T488_9ZZZZ